LTGKWNKRRRGLQNGREDCRSSSQQLAAGRGLKRVGNTSAEDRHFVCELCWRPGWKSIQPPKWPENQQGRQCARLPVCLTPLGNGIVGRIMRTHSNEAERTVRLALEILSRQSSSRACHDITGPFRSYYSTGNRWTAGDWTRTGCPGSIVLNRPRPYGPSIKDCDWELHLPGPGLAGLRVAGSKGISRERPNYRRPKNGELDQFFNVTLDLLGIANTEGYFLRLNPAAEGSSPFP